MSRSNPSTEEESIEERQLKREQAAAKVGTEEPAISFYFPSWEHLMAYIRRKDTEDALRP